MISKVIDNILPEQIHGKRLVYPHILALPKNIPCTICIILGWTKMMGQFSTNVANIGQPNSSQSHPPSVTMQPRIIVIPIQTIVNQAKPKEFQHQMAAWGLQYIPCTFLQVCPTVCASIYFCGQHALTYSSLRSKDCSLMNTLYLFSPVTVSDSLAYL